MAKRKIVNKKASIGLALSALGLAGSVQSAKADETVQNTNQKTETLDSSLASSSASSAASHDVFAKVASDAHNQFSSAAHSLDSETANASSASSAAQSAASSAVSSTASSAVSSTASSTASSAASSVASSTVSSAVSSTALTKSKLLTKAAIRKTADRFAKTATFSAFTSGGLPSLSNASRYSNYDHSTSLTDPETPKASYKKGEDIPVRFAFANSTNTAQDITASMTVYHGAAQVGDTKSITKTLLAGKAYDVANEDQGTFTIDNSLLDNDSGYTVQIKVTDATGNVLDTKNLGLAIEDDWTKFPRYGVIAGSGDHAAGIPNDPALMQKYSKQIDEMKNMHVNSYFFYDVYKDAANPFPDEASYTQQWVTWTQNKPQISTQAIKDLVSKVHDTGASAMLYNMIHAKNTYENQSNTPGLPDDSQLAYNANDGFFGKKGEIMTGAAASQQYYNPASPSWQNFITKVMLDAMKRGNFDGWNGDTNGDNIITTSEDRGTDKTFHIQDTYGIFSKAVMDAFKGKNNGKDYYYTVNNVNAGGIKDSMANESVVYAELWPNGNFNGNPLTEYGDLKKVVDYVRENSGKNPIISAYLKNNAIGADNTYNTNAELLTTAAIAASGGYHMELDANANNNDAYGVGVLGNEYYPNQDHKVSEDLNRLLYQYSQFQVQYENFLRGSDVVNDTALAKTYDASGKQISYNDNNGDKSGRYGNQVWTFTKKGNGFKTIQLINLMGINSDWDNTSHNNKKDPEVQKNLSVLYPLGKMSLANASGYAENVYVTSPDDWNKGSMVKAKAQVVNNGDGTYSLKITVPQLSLWDVVYIQDPANVGRNGQGASFTDGDITYTTSEEHKNVNRTVNYVMSDGSNPPAAKHDSLTFTKTLTVGSLKTLIDRATADGLTVNKGAVKNYDDSDKAINDLNTQIPAIKKILDDYESKKAGYDIAKAAYDQALAKWNAAQNDPHTVGGISQQLTFVNENNANIAISSPSGSPINYIKKAAWQGNDGHGVYRYNNIAKSFTDDQITHDVNEATVADSSHDNAWGNTYTGIRMKVGDTVQATYTNLNNSAYTDANGNIRKIGSAKISYTLNSTTANDGTANVFLSNSPTVTFWFTASGDKRDNAVDFTINLEFYDTNGNKIDLGKGSNAWISMSSLNRRDAIEYFNPGGNTAKEIPGSTIIPHGDGLWHSDINNEESNKDWDTLTAANRYYGAAVMEYEGQPFHVGKKLLDAQFAYDWFNLNTNLATAYLPKVPTVPDELINKPSITCHDVEYSSWDDPQDFDDVDSPFVDDYTPDKETVSNTDITYDHVDINETVTYTPGKQTAHVTYIDDTTGKTLDTKTLEGGSNDHSGYTTKQSIDSYVAAGYELVSDSTNGKEIVYDNDSNVDQDYTVHLKHRSIQPSDDSHVHHATVTRTINYQMSDGSTPPTNRLLSLSFTGQDTIDAVTKQTIRTDWTPSQEFAAVPSPEIQGYTPDQAVVPKLTASHDSANTVVTVRYTPDAQRATVTFIDDTTGKTMEVKTLTGGSNAKSGYTTASSINAYKFVGYQLVSDQTNGAEIVFDHDAKVDQNYVVHMKHTASSATNVDKKYVHRTITYVMADGSSAPIPVTQTLTFTASGSLDSITKQIGNVVWSGDQTFAPVNTPAVDGYTPDKAVVSSVTVGHDHADINEVVTYVPKNANATVTYIDDATGQTLKTDALTGKAGTLTGYSTANTIDGYTARGYKLVSDETGQNNIIMPANQTNFVVHLNHETEEINDDSLTKTVTRTIHYVVEDGKVPAPNDRVDTLTFTAKVVKDKVTGQTVSTIWSPKRNFPIVYSPAITGYTPDLPVAGYLLVAYNSPDSHEVITYKPNGPATPVTPPVVNTSVTVKYIDDTTGRTIKTDVKSGPSNTDSGYTTKSTIDGLKNKGYALVSDQTNGKSVVFTDTDKTYAVHVKHEQETATHNKTVNRTIRYVMSDGTTPPKPVKDALTFTETVVKDKVTGAVVKDDWSPNQDFRDVASPAVKGYTVDRAVVSDKNIPYNHADIIETVVYTPENQKGTITYVDQTTGTVLETNHIQGASNAKSGYTTANSLKIWEAYGYELVKDETGGKEIIFDNDPNVDQNYTVTLKHGVKTEDTNAVVKRTIDYVVKGSKVQAPAPVHDSLTFKGTVTIDKVTGKVANITWSNPQDFKDIESPVIKGYKVDRTLVSDKDIAHDHPDIHEVVTYTPDTQKAKVIYIDDTTNQTLKTDDIAGDPGTDSGYNTKSVVQNYLDNGYELVSDQTNGKNVVFDDDSSVDQTYYVHFKHGTVTVDPNHPQTPNRPINKNPNGAKYPDGVSKQDLTKTVTRTVNYRMADGSTPPAPVKDAKTFDKTLVIDKVTGQILSSGWTPSQEFDKVDSPIVDGYTPDKESVPAITVDHTSSDIAETVVYTPIIKKGSVVFVDTVTNKTIKTKNLEGKAGQKSGYSTAGDIKELEGQGYVLVQDDTNGQELLFDGQNYTVKLAHRIDHTLDWHEAIRTVVFHLPTGDKTVKQIADVVRTVNKDAVTGSVTYGDWSTNKWKALDVLTAKGFTPSLDQIAEEMVSGDTKDKTIDVYYKAAAKNAKAEIPASASSAVSSAASSASSAPSSAASSVASSVASSSVSSSVSSAAPSSAASSAPSSVASSVAAKAISARSTKTLPQTGADELAAVMESVLGLASAIAGGGLLKKKRHKTNKKNKN